MLLATVRSAVHGGTTVKMLDWQQLALKPQHNNLCPVPSKLRLYGTKNKAL